MSLVTCSPASTRRIIPAPLSVTLVAVALSWFAIALIGALPFVFGLHISYTNRVFEAMSGWTGSGFTMLTSVDTTPNTLLFWRSFTQWIGGIGIIAGEATRPCGNMKGGTCMIFGTVHKMLPTFETIGTKVLPDRKVTMTIYKGDIANRGKGTIMVKIPDAFNG